MTDEMLDAWLKAKKCATPGCERPARWISIWAPPRRTAPFKRRCATCCDRMSHLMSLLRDRPA